LPDIRYGLELLAGHLGVILSHMAVVERKIAVPCVTETARKIRMLNDRISGIERVRIKPQPRNPISVLSKPGWAHACRKALPSMLRDPIALDGSDHRHGLEIATAGRLARTLSSMIKMRGPGGVNADSTPLPLAWPLRMPGRIAPVARVKANVAIGLLPETTFMPASPVVRR